MANENPVTEEPAPDPFEAELVAYLDGELDPAAARKVEARLAKDPAARARAAELKKSFDMLDYLPRPEPSPNFTTRTLDKLPAVKPTASGGMPAQPQPQTTATGRPNSPKSAPPGSGASSPLSLSLDEDEPLEPRLQPSRPRPLLWAVVMVAAVSVFAALGYFATAAIRPQVFPTKEGDEAKVEVSARVIDNLPLYAVADDIAFVTELSKPDLFGEDPAIAYDSTLKVPAIDLSEKPTAVQAASLTKSYRLLPAARQAEIVKLDHDLFAKDARERDRLFRVLEAYAMWLERLPEAERRGVLTAATPELRLGVIRKLREQQWRESLPPALKGKEDAIKHWKDEEAYRRDRWAFIRQHAAAFAANKSPWPFDTEAGKASVIDFARDVLKVDDPKRCRLTPEELAEYRRTLQAAQRDSAWAWYGLLVYELAQHHPYLPEPTDSKLMLSDMPDLPDPLSRFLKKSMSFKLQAVRGKWPEFPLQLHNDMQGGKWPIIPPLGPARLNDFKEPVRTFATKELFPKMTSEEKRELQRLEGRWPEYPHRFLHFAHKYDLGVPGVTLPGSPKRWETTYGLRAGPRPNN